MKGVKVICTGYMLIGLLSAWTHVESPPKLSVKDISIGYDEYGRRYIYLVDEINKIFYKKKGDFPWDSLDHRLYQHIPQQDVNPTCIITEPNNSDTVYVGIEGYKVYKSENGGDIWEPKYNGITNPYPRCFAMDPLYPNILYLGCASAAGVSVFKTEDGGENWIPSNLTDVEVMDIKVNPANN